MNEILHAGIPYKHYSAVHHWLRANYGPADRCEAQDCRGVNTKFQWAKKRGVQYEKIRENFIRLCRSCHSKYDWTDNHRKLASRRMRRKPPSYYALLYSLKTDFRRTKEARKNIVRALIANGHTRKVRAFSLDGKLVYEADTLSDAARHFGLLHQSISRALDRSNNRYGGYIWKSASDQLLSGEGEIRS